MILTLRTVAQLGRHGCRYLGANISRSLVSSPQESQLDSSLTTVQHALVRRAKPDHTKVPFGQAGCSDHMLTVRWEEGRGWEEPRILPYGELSLDPCSKVLHYAQEVFEGMKAYRGVDGRVRLFRPDLNMKRMNRSARRAQLPTFPPGELLGCIQRLIEVDESWVPASSSSSLYVRPTLIGTQGSLGLAPSTKALLFVVLCPVGSYYSQAARPVSLLCDPRFSRAVPGGAGDSKLGSNYAPTLMVQEGAAREGCDQVLWVQGPDQELAEVGAMNIFVVLRGEQGEQELVTPPLDGTVLPGVTRQSVLEMMREGGHVARVEERTICLAELLAAQVEGRLVEVFATGTAAVVNQVGRIRYKGTNYSIPTPLAGLATRSLKQLTDIYYGRLQHPWATLLHHHEQTDATVHSSRFVQHA